MLVDSEWGWSALSLHYWMTNVVVLIMHTFLVWILEIFLCLFVIKLTIFCLTTYITPVNWRLVHYSLPISKSMLGMTPIPRRLRLFEITDSFTNSYFLSYVVASADTTETACGDALCFWTAVSTTTTCSKHFNKGHYCMRERSSLCNSSLWCVFMSWYNTLTVKYYSSQGTRPRPSYCMQRLLWRLSLFLDCVKSHREMTANPEHTGNL